jgi:hypothetical protein
MNTQRHKLLPFITVTGVIFSMIVVLGLTFFYQVEQLFVTALDCPAEVQERKESPDGRYIAVVFSWECSATVGFNTQLSIVKRGDSFSPTQHRAFLILAGRHQLELSWTDGNVLAVLAPVGAKTFKQEQPENSVQVKYQ